MMALQKNHVVTVPLSSVYHRLKQVEPDLYAVAKTTMG